MSKLLLDNYTYVRGVNASSTDFTVGTLVYVSNWINSVPQFDLAISTDSTKYANGMVLQTIPVGGTGRILTEGKIKLDNKDSSLQEGDILYLSNVAGEYTTTSPSDVYKVGEVIKDNTNDVTVFFSPDFLIPSPVTPYTDEMAQDAVGSIVNSTLTYTDATPLLSVNLSNSNTWLADQSVPDEAYDATTWNGSLEVPTKNAIRDKIETMPSVPFIQTASATVSNTLTETTIIGTGVGTMTIPANGFTVGKTLRLTWRGILSDTGTPTLRVRVKVGSTTIGDTGAIALVGSITNEEWSVYYITTCRTTGISGTIFGQGDFHFDNSASEGLTFGMPSTAATTIDTTVSQLISITVEWGSADAADTITSTNGILEALN